MLYRSLIALTVVAVCHAVPTRDLAHQSVHTLSVRKLADLNPAKTKDACKACVDGQSDVQTKEAAALAAADDNAAMLTKVNTQEEAAAKALKAEKAALVAYQAAQDDLAAAEDGLKKTQGAQKALQAAEDSAKSAAFEAKTALKTKCEGFDLGVINTDAPPPSPPPPPPAKLTECPEYGVGSGVGGYDVYYHQEGLGVYYTAQDCENAVKTQRPDADGMTFEDRTSPVPGAIGDFLCFAEFGLTGTNGNPMYKTCKFPKKEVFSCVYHAGDGNGPHEQYLGQAPTEQGCTDMVRSANLGANGATYSSDGSLHCYAEFGMTGWAGGAGHWQSCIF